MLDKEILMEKLDSMEPIIEYLDDPEINAISTFLADRIASPDSFVTLLGETSSGKSTLINSFIGRTLLPVKACPTTGAVCEIIFDPDQEEDHFYRIDKNALYNEIDKGVCMSLVEDPDKELSRVRIITKAPNASVGNMRVFDTPGYDSIVQEHEEILKDFLPNSDVVIYVVGYKIGIQDNDYNFLRSFKEIVREDTDIILVINRCPEGVDSNNARVSEIRRYAADILNREVPFFLLPDTKAENGQRALPPTDKLWRHVSETVNSDKRTTALHEAFEEYIIGLYEKCRDMIRIKYLEMKMDEEELKETVNLQKETAKRIRKAVDLYIKPGFKSVSAAIPGKVDKAASSAGDSIISEIKSSPTTKMDEMRVYVQHHLAPHYMGQETKEIMFYIETCLEDMNEKVDDYLNKEISEFDRRISVISSSHLETAGKNILKRTANRVGYNALFKYFAGFGGAGGANAGIANAASHTLKKVGDLFGKTFSRETHNALKAMLAKIGATSMKTVGNVFTVIIELITVIYDYATWKKKLISKVEQSVDNWAKEAKPMVLSELEKLKAQNIENINRYADEIEHTFDEAVNVDSAKIEQAEKMIRLLDEIGQKIGA